MIKPNRSGFDSLKKVDLQGLPWSWVDISSAPLLSGINIVMHNFSLPLPARRLTITKIFLQAGIYNGTTFKLSPYALSTKLRITDSNGAHVQGVAGSNLFIPMSAMGFFDRIEFSWNVPPNVTGLVFQVESLNAEPSITDMRFETVLFVQGIYYL